MDAIPAPTGSSDFPTHARSPLPTPPHDWRWWARRLLVCNPFFLVSAALLLFAVNRLANDPGFLGGDQPKLLFNFGALQLYEALLVVTAVVLARRRVLYDSALLVVLEHGLALVPFILISQAAQLDPDLARILILGGGLIVAGRSLVIRRGYPTFNLPPRALALGLVLLVFNAALPLWFRSVLDHQSIWDWVEPNRQLWLFALPVLALGANLLPHPTRHDGAEPQRPWLPLFIYGLWIIGTGTQIASVGWLGQDVKLSLPLLVPVTLATVWTLLNRLGDISPFPSPKPQMFLLCLAAAVPMFASEAPAELVTLALINVALFILLASRGPLHFRPLARNLALASLALGFVGMPVEWMGSVWPGWNRLDALLLVLAAYASVFGFRSRHPAVGLAAGISFGIVLQRLNLGVPPSVVWQLAGCLILAHSLRWLPGSGADRTRWAVGGCWLLLALPTPTIPFPALGELQGLMLLTLWLIAWRFTGRKGSFTLPTISGVALVETPVRWVAAHATAGMLALAGSFLLFGFGAWFACNRRMLIPELAPKKTDHVKEP